MRTDIVPIAENGALLTFESGGRGYHPPTPFFFRRGVSPPSSGFQEEGYPRLTPPPVIGFQMWFQ